MRQVSGPFDGRKARKKRCDRCVERRIKCVGGRPCLNCSRTDRVCRTTAKQEATTWVFVQAQTQNVDKVYVQRQRTVIPLPRPVSPAGSDTYLAYFFTSFLTQNAFTGVSEDFQISLSSLLHSSSALRDAINAISALHLAQNTITPAKSDNSAALHAYSRSVRCLQTTIASVSIVRDPSALWTTLLLGVFELMRDLTGTNWLMHFLHGTSTMLCLQGPGMLLKSGWENEHYQAFFVTARIFEISRALIYTKPTFLATPEWSAAVEVYWTRHATAWTPKEALFDILPRFADLAVRTLEFVTGAQSISHNTAASLAQEGLVLRSALATWYSALSAWTPLHTDKHGAVALIHYHTISIYLDGIFSYHAPFTSPSAPRSPLLDRGATESHVEEILALSCSMLAEGCAGILLFFPLRVAGARARDAATRTKILRILQLITQRGFAVAQSFVDDLRSLWGVES